MVFSDQTYSVLVVSAAQKFNEAFAAMLPGSEYYPVPVSYTHLTLPTNSRV